MNTALPTVSRSRSAELLFARRMNALKPSAIREILKTTEAPDVISFAGGLPAPELFPTALISDAAQRVLKQDGPGALQYGVTEGILPLRQWVCAEVRKTVQLPVDPSQVLVTHGSQQGLDLIAKVLLDPGDTVLVENPAYLGALQAFQSYEASIVGIPSDLEGIRLDALEEILQAPGSRPKFLYVIPNYQNPTGTSWSANRRRDVAQLAARYDLLIVEDDPYGRLRFSGEEQPALGATAGAGTWVYLGSTSKILAPGLRVGWLCTSSTALHQRLVTAKQASDLHTSSLTQRIVAELVSQPELLEAHVAKLIQVYGHRRDVMLRSLRRHMPTSVRWTEPAGGLFLWVTLQETFDTLALLQRAATHKVAFVPGAPFWVGRAPTNTLRLNFSNASDERIEVGIERLGLLIRADGG